MQKLQKRKSRRAPKKKALRSTWMNLTGLSNSGNPTSWVNSCFVRWNFGFSLLLFYPLAFPDFLTGRIPVWPLPSSFPCQSWRTVCDLKYSSFPSSIQLDALDSPEACHALWLNFALHVTSSRHSPVKKAPLVMSSSMNAVQMKKFVLWQCAHLHWSFSPLILKSNSCFADFFQKACMCTDTLTLWSYCKGELSVFKGSGYKENVFYNNSSETLEQVA